MDWRRVKEEFAVYLSSVENLHTSCSTEEDVQWLHRREDDINKFKEKLHSLISDQDDQSSAVAMIEGVSHSQNLPRAVPNHETGTEKNPAGRLASVTRKHNEIVTILSSPALDYGALMTEFAAYLLGVENLYSACNTSTSLLWLSPHRSRINKFKEFVRQKLAESEEK